MNRIELTFNGKMIMGITCEYERPSNSEELREILHELISMSDSLEEKTLEPLITIEPYNYFNAPYLGNYIPYGPRAYDAEGTEYCADTHGLFRGHLLFRLSGDTEWSDARLLTDADRLQFSKILF
jgi:hypothetical protein